MTAPETSLRPRPRPWGDEGPGPENGYYGSDDDDQQTYELDRPITRQEAEEWGIDYDAFVEEFGEGALDNLGELLEASGSEAARALGSALKGATKVTEVIDIIEDFGDVITVEEFDGTLGTAQITVDHRAFAETVVSTGISFGTFGISDIIQRDGESGSDYVGRKTADGLEAVGDAVGTEVHNRMENIINNTLNSSTRAQPVVLDLDGDGIEFWSGSGNKVDVDNDGFKEHVAWVYQDDGLLVFDLNADGSRGDGDGQIDQTKEFIFTEWNPAARTDLHALAISRDSNGQLIFDTNGDKKLTSSDSSWNEFKIWQDKNFNGEVDDNELKSLNDHGITQISLRYDNGKGYGDTSDDISLLNNIVHGRASFTKDGNVNKGGVGDFSFAYDPIGYRVIEEPTRFVLEYEDGDRHKYWKILPDRSPDMTISIIGLYGGIGDERANKIDGSQGLYNLYIDGFGGNDDLRGSNQNDVLLGGTGDDHIIGGSGNDYINGDTGSDVIGAGSGDDTVYGGAGHGHDTLYGGSGNDIMSGGFGHDNISGGYGDDIIEGGRGEDRINGGPGKDVMRGGAAADTFVFNADHVGTTDYVYGFQDGLDTLELHNISMHIWDTDYFDVKVESVVEDGKNFAKVTFEDHVIMVGGMNADLLDHNDMVIFEDTVISNDMVLADDMIFV